MRSLFPNAWTIARREYEQRVRNRGFLIVTALLAVLGLALALTPLAIRALGGDKPVALAIYADDAGLAADSTSTLDQILTASTPRGEAGFQLSRASSVAEGQAAVRAGETDALLTISRGTNQELAFDVFTDEGPTSRVLLTLRSAASQLNIGDRLARAGIDTAKAGEIFAATPLTVTPVDTSANNAKDDFGPRFIVAYALVVLIFTAVVTYGNWVAASVAEEKSSRVMELLVTAATPRQLLAGKVLGSGAAGLTQYLVVVIAALAGLLLQGVIAHAVLGAEAASGDTLQVLTPLVLAIFGLFFIGGFALYATLYAALGSAASRQEDLPATTGPMIVVALAGYMASFIALPTIDETWVRVLSFVPFFSPYLIPARLILGQIAPWEILLAAGILAATLAVAQGVAARLYSAGVLLYGQRVGVRTLWKAVRVHR